MKVKFPIVYILLVLTSLSSYQKYNEAYFMRGLDAFIEEDGKGYNLSSPDGWEISTVFDGVRDGIFDVIHKKEDSDTLKSLALYISKENDQPFIESYYSTIPFSHES